MDYTTFGKYLKTAVRKNTEVIVPALKKAGNAGADKKRWGPYRTIVGNIALKMFDKFQDWKYTNIEE